MSNKAPRGTGMPVRPHPEQPPHSVNFSVPRVRVPLLVTIDQGRLWARPAEPNSPVISPPDGAWRNFADTGPEDLRQIAAIAGRFGALSPSAADSGESLAVWHHLIDDLRELAGAWTAEGDIADSVAVDNARLSAERMQGRLCEDHQDNGGRFFAVGPGGWALKTADMGQWWRLAAIAAVYQQAPLRRCRFCSAWFSLGGQRADNGFCSARHRSAYYQKNRHPPSAPWAEVI